MDIPLPLRPSTLPLAGLKYLHLFFSAIIGQLPDLPAGKTGVMYFQQLQSLLFATGALFYIHPILLHHA
jgi:hypothetical protein